MKAKILRGLATLLEGAGCIFMKVLTNFSFYFLFSVLLCCVVEDNVFKSCVNTQSIVIECHLGIPSPNYAGIHEKVLAIEYFTA